MRYNFANHTNIQKALGYVWNLQYKSHKCNKHFPKVGTAEKHLTRQLYIFYTQYIKLQHFYLPYYRGKHLSKTMQKIIS